MKKIKEFIKKNHELIIGITCVVVTGVIGIILTQKVLEKSLEETKELELEGERILKALKESVDMDNLEPIAEQMYADHDKYVELELESQSSAE